MAEPEVDMLLDDIARVLAAPFPRVAEQFSALIAAQLPHTAAVVMTETLTGDSYSAAGEATITDRIRATELQAVRARTEPDRAVRGRHVVGGTSRSVLTVVAGSGPLLLLVDPENSSVAENTNRSAVSDAPSSSPSDARILRLWRVIGPHAQHRAMDPPPDALRASRAFSGARAEAIAALTDEHAMSLEAMLLALRASRVSDRSARITATRLAASALIHLREASDRVHRMTEEPVTNAFARFRADLEPLAALGDVDLQFVEPPIDDIPLPREVAYGARAIAHSAVLALIDRHGVTKMRVHWQCDERDLVIDIRDDGPGALVRTSPRVHPLQHRARALGGEARLTSVPGWGSEISVVIPLASRPAPPDDAMLRRLAPREQEVLGHLVVGRRNREIAEQLGISENTVKFHVSRILRKLGVRSRGEAVARARALGPER